MRDLYADKPIIDASEDVLGRKDFSEKIAHYLLSPSSNDGLVVAINGKWGSGKTSIANLIKKGIKEEVENRKKKNKGARRIFDTFQKTDAIFPIIVDYSPWNVTEQDGIINQFLKTLDQGFAYKKVLETAKNVFGLFSKILFFTPVPSPLKKMVRDVDDAFSNYIKALNEHDGDLEDFKKKVEGSLKKSRFRYLVFIDDLDRLNKSEIKLLIQLIKSICNFPNITYILMFDKSIICDALSDQQSVSGAEYLEKIVQLEFNVPFIEKNKMIDILSDDLDDLLNDKIDDSDRKAITKYLSFGMYNGISTIRAEKRYLNNLRFAIDIFGRQLYIPDLLAITYLRLVDEKAYELFVKNQDSLLGIKQYTVEDKAKAKNEFIRELKEKTKLDYKTHKYLIDELFPHMFSDAPDNNGEDYRKGRLFIPNHFHKYMNMDYDPEDFSLERINNLLKFDNSSDNLSDFSKTLKPEQERKLLNVLVEYCSNLKNPKVFSIVLDYLFKRLSVFERPTGLFVRDKRYYVMNVCSSLINNLKPDEIDKVLVDSVKNGSDVGALVELANYCTGVYESRAFDASKISKKAKQQIIEAILDKTLDYLDKNIDDNSYDLHTAIRFAIDRSGERMHNIAEKKDNRWLIAFITKAAYVSTSYSTSEGKRYYPCYQIDGMKRVLSIDGVRIDSLIAECTSNKGKQRLIVFKMQMEGKKPKYKDNFGFSMQEIQDYCDDNNIDFIASDDYEG